MIPRCRDNKKENPYWKCGKNPAGQDFGKRDRTQFRGTQPREKDVESLIFSAVNKDKEAKGSISKRVRMKRQGERLTMGNLSPPGNILSFLPDSHETGMCPHWEEKFFFFSLPPPQKSLSLLKTKKFLKITARHAS